MRNKSVDDDDNSEESTPIAVAVPLDPRHLSTGASAPPLATSVISTGSAAGVGRLTADTSNDEAYALSLSSREETIADIRNHCEQHLSQNPNSSYVTWIATPHPENAQVTIDSRFLISHNPWLTVYKEVKENLQKGKGITATATAAPSTPEEDEDTETAPTYRGCLDLFISRLLILICIMISFVLEIVGIYAYFSYWLCCKIVNKCRPVGAFSWLPYFVAFIFAQAFRLMDVLLFFSSLFMVELTAALNYLLCTIFACSVEVGKNVHQMTRKLSHHIRWAFRHKFEDCNPSRSYFKRGPTSLSTFDDTENETL